MIYNWFYLVKYSIARIVSKTEYKYRTDNLFFIGWEIKSKMNIVKNCLRDEPFEDRTITIVIYVDDMVVY